MVLYATPPRDHTSLLRERHTRTHQMQSWDLDVRTHRARLRRLDNFRFDILSDPATTTSQQPAAAATTAQPLLLDLSPDERESRAAGAVKGRRKAAAEAIKGVKLALRDLEDWTGLVVAERAVVVAFLDLVDPALAFVAGASCDAAAGAGEVCAAAGVGVGVAAAAAGGGGGGGDGSTGSGGGVGVMTPRDVDVVVADPSFLAAERGGASGGSDAAAAAAGAGMNEDGRLRRPASWAGTGPEASAPKTSTISSRSREGSVEGHHGVGGGGGSRRPAVGFLRALGALDPCVSALREARSSATTGDRLSLALETLREHVKVTLIDLMDLETSIPGDAGEDSDGDDSGDDNDGDSGGKKCAAARSALALSSADAGALDVKVAGLVRRLSGGRVSGSSSNGISGGGDYNSNTTGGGGGEGTSRGGPPSLANVYEDGLQGAAAASETEVDTTESLTARALGMVTRAVAGPMLWALDDAYQVGEQRKRVEWGWGGG